MRPQLISVSIAILALALCGTAQAEPAEDAGALTPTFQEGDVIGVDDLDKIRAFLPDQFWDNRDFFFYEGMRLEIGPFDYDYSPNDVFKAATQEFRGQARIGPDNSLEGYVAGWPFHPDSAARVEVRGSRVEG